MKRAAAFAIVVLAVPALFAATQGAPIPLPLPLFPATNWWNTDVSSAPVDANSAAYISFIGGTGRALHPDFGGDVSTGSVDIYGFPYILVNGNTQAKKSVLFDYSDESDGVDHTTNTSFPFYPIPDETITQAHWIEAGDPGNVPYAQLLNGDSDRHMLIVDVDNNDLYELYHVWYNDGRDTTTPIGWHAGSGAFFDMNTNNPRPDGWTSADAAGLAILPGLVRYDEVYGSNPEIGHAFRVTVQSTNGYVYPASHKAGSTAGALPMGARLRLKSTVDISGFAPYVQKIFRAFKKYGLIVADNGTNMYISGSYDNRWDNGVLNPAFGALHASDFDVIQLGWKPVLTRTAGDVNGDGIVNVADVFYLINFLYAGGPAPVFSADFNADAVTNAADVVYLLNYLFAGGTAPH